MDDLTATKCQNDLEAAIVRRFREEVWELFNPEIEMIRDIIHRGAEEMKTQRDLFNPFSREYAAQGELFDQGPQLSALSCVECGEALERTPSGYLCCPKGHGRLLCESVNPSEDSPV